MTSSNAPPAFQLPAALLSQGFALRLETEDDIPFLKSLYASTREAELAPVPWPPEQKADFLAMQFDLQRRHYRQHTPDCTWWLIEHHGAPAGRLYLQAWAARMHIVDISLAPAWRGHGVGAAILEALIAEAGAGGKSVGIFVEKFNPALKLYRRLGFTEISDTDVYLEMEWRAEQDAKTGVS